MKTESVFHDVSPRTDRIYRLERKKERLEKTIRESRYDRKTDLLSDWSVWEGIEKEIEVQKCYRQLEERYWDPTPTL